MSVTFDPDNFIDGHGVHPVLDQAFRDRESRIRPCNVDLDIKDLTLAERLQSAALDELYRTETKPVIRKIGITHYLITLAILLILGAAVWAIFSYTAPLNESSDLQVTPLPAFVGTTVEIEPESADSGSPSQALSEGESVEAGNGYPSVYDEVEVATSPSLSVYRITCYDAPDFPLTAITASGLTLAQAIEKSEGMGLDGVCAVSPDSPWYAGRKAANQVLSVEGHGLYLVVDCTAPSIHRTIDLYGCDGGGFREWRQVMDVSEVTR